MAKKVFLVDIDLSKNELENAAIQNLGADPSGAVSGQVYYNTATKKLKIFNGTAWEDVGKSVNLAPYVKGPSSAAANSLAAFSGTTGKLLRDSGVMMNDVEQAVTDSHTHSNKAILDGITNKGSGKIMTSLERDSLNDVVNELSDHEGKTNNPHSVTYAQLPDKPNIPSIPANIVTSAANGATDYIAVYGGANKTIKKGTSKISTLVSATSTAQAKANLGVTNAATAQAKADSAYTKASGAQSTADDAQTDANAAYNKANAALPKNGSGTMTGNLKMGSKKITGLANGTAATDAVNKGQMDTAISGVTGGVTYKGGYNAATDTPPIEGTPATVKKGDMYAVTHAGIVYGVHLEVGNTIIANKNNPTAKADWTMLQGDLDHASLTKAGIIELATQAETTAGSDANRAVTPKTLKGVLGTATGVTLAHSAKGQIINPGKTVTISHNFGYKPVAYSAVQDGKGVEVEFTTATTTSAKFSVNVAPATGKNIEIVITG